MFITAMEGIEDISFSPMFWGYAWYLLHGKRTEKSIVGTGMGCTALSRTASRGPRDSPEENTHQSTATQAEPAAPGTDLGRRDASRLLDVRTRVL